MAAVSMTLAVASRTFVSVRSETALGRNGGALTMALPMATSSALSCTFAADSRRAIIARASDLEQGSEVSVEEDAPAAAAAAPAVQQGSKLYVGNLPWSCDSTQLAEICQDIGEVEIAEVIYDRDSGRSKGFAFVTMASAKDAQAVIDALDGTDLGGRVLRVNYPQSQSDKPRFERGERQDRRPSRRFDDPNKLFVGNLTWACDEVALETLFADFGKVVEAKIVTDRETGRSRGFGFVTLADASEVNNAIQNLDGAEYDGRQLRVNLAGDKPPPRPQFD